MEDPEPNTIHPQNPEPKQRCKTPNPLLSPAGCTLSSVPSTQHPPGIKAIPSGFPRGDLTVLFSFPILPPFPQDWPFDDGAPPPSKIVEDWLNLLKTKFCEDPGCCVAVHCVAGLGR